MEISATSRAITGRPLARGQRRHQINGVWVGCGVVVDGGVGGWGVWMLVGAVVVMWRMVRRCVRVMDLVMFMPAG